MKQIVRPAQLLLASLVVIVTGFNSVSTVWAAGTPADPPAGSTFEQRLAQRKAEQNVVLNKDTLDHIQQTCQDSLDKLRALQTKATTVASSRNTTYQTMDGTLLIVTGQLKIAAIDTFTLEQDRGTFVQKITLFKTTSSNYQQTLADLLAVNCQADPTGYEALLATARYYYGQLQTQSVDIAKYITDTVQPILKNFATQLEPKSNVGDNN